ncbi:hypothetical protein [Streptomyces fractus]|uniref:DUF7848 domain-containing protein n=1 Tax=Streptomyces fractus TaxID=641806 RepID=UPI003CF70E58
MTRATFRHRTFRIMPDHEPDAEPWTFQRHCGVCNASSEPTEALDQAEDWNEAHLKANPGHLSYRETITRPYRAEPGAWL